MEEKKLFPKLSEEAKQEVDEYLLSFKEKIQEQIEDLLTKVYDSPLMYIESDAWCNFRNELLHGLKNYPDAKIRDKYDWVAIRAEIFKEHKDEMINDYIQDLRDEIKTLKNKIVYIQEMNNYRIY